MALETLLPLLLIAQGVMGGVDTLLNHELIERLPHRMKARTEIGLHAIREAIYATLFAGLGWYAWHGAAAAAIAALLAAEILVTCCDEYVENQTRVMPQNERVLHIFLTLNLGVIIAVLAPVLLEWSTYPTRWVPVDYGLPSWVLSALAITAIAWSIRDALAWRRLRRERNRGG